MHIYIYDSWLSQKKYLSELNEIESKLTDLGLSGRVCRLGRLRSLSDIVRQELRRMPKAIVAVGDDSIISQVISLLGASGVPLGIIPIGDNNKIAQGLGINSANACNVLSARRIIEIDLGLVNNRAFVRRAEIIGPRLKLLIDDNYIIETNGTRVEVINFMLDTEEFVAHRKPRPQSGCLYLLITKEESGFLKKRTEQSLVPFKKLTIETDEAAVKLDGSSDVNRPRQITILPDGLSVIVGRERRF